MAPLSQVRQLVHPRPSTERSTDMPRIHTIDSKTATGDTKVLFDAAQAKLGAVPNFLRVLGHSPRALAGFLNLYGELDAGALDRPTRERIALVVAEGNRCAYCLSAHTAIGRHAGLSNDEMLRNRAGGSADAKARAAVAFAKTLNDHTGEVTPAEFRAVRTAGLSDAEIMEIIAAVALNVFTNLIGKATEIDIDFPIVSPFTQGAAA